MQDLLEMKVARGKCFEAPVAGIVPRPVGGYYSREWSECIRVNGVNE